MDLSTQSYALPQKSRSPALLNHQGQSALLVRAPPDSCLWPLREAFTLAADIICLKKKEKLRCAEKALIMKIHPSALHIQILKYSGQILS